MNEDVFELQFPEMLKLLQRIYQEGRLNLTFNGDSLIVEYQNRNYLTETFQLGVIQTQPYEVDNTSYLEDNIEQATSAITNVDSELMELRESIEDLRSQVEELRYG